MTRSSSRPTPPRRYLVGAALSLVWALVAVLTAALAATAAFAFPGPLVTFVVAGTTGLVVGGFSFGFGEADRAGAWRGARIGGWVFCLAVVVVGLWSLLGVLGAGLVLVALASGCPAVWSAVSRLGRRRRTRPSSATSVYGPEALRSAHEADLEAVQAVPAPSLSAPVERVGGVDMTEFEVALLQAEDAGRLDGADPDPVDGARHAELAGLGLAELCKSWRRTSVLLRHGVAGPRLTLLLQTRQHLLDELMRRDPAGTRAWMAAVDQSGDDPGPFLATGPGTA